MEAVPSSHAGADHVTKRLGSDRAPTGADKSNSNCTASLWTDWETALLNSLVQQGYNKHTDWEEVSQKLRKLSGTVRTTTEVFTHFCTRKPEKQWANISTKSLEDIANVVAYRELYDSQGPSAIVPAASRANPAKRKHSVAHSGALTWTAYADADNHPHFQPVSSPCEPRHGYPSAAAAHGPPPWAGVHHHPSELPFACPQPVGYSPLCPLPPPFFNPMLYSPPAMPPAIRRPPVLSMHPQQLKSCPYPAAPTWTSPQRVKRQQQPMAQRVTRQQQPMAEAEAEVRGPAAGPAVSQSCAVPCDDEPNGPSVCTCHTKTLAKESPSQSPRVVPASTSPRAQAAGSSTPPQEGFRRRPVAAPDTPPRSPRVVPASTSPRAQTDSSSTPPEEGFRRGPVAAPTTAAGAAAEKNAATAKVVVANHAVVPSSIPSAPSDHGAEALPAALALSAMSKSARASPKNEPCVQSNPENRTSDQSHHNSVRLHQLEVALRAVLIVDPTSTLQLTGSRERRKALLEKNCKARGIDPARIERLKRIQVETGRWTVMELLDRYQAAQEQIEVMSAADANRAIKLRRHRYTSGEVRRRLSHPDWNLPNLKDGQTLVCKICNASDPNPTTCDAQMLDDDDKHYDLNRDNNPMAIRRNKLCLIPGIRPNPAILTLLEDSSEPQSSLKGLPQA